ncbi:hypothetical protein DPEC_G00176690 [Dallia pectoralis]|uniref:Uncharacterized protein n=1 Tax=Dallia pectoralis TaxID=75939 RepID=A0ACC2GF45_DALPE|nr:hypothetical protein DPEC_G00176690 [Dallia pectoralis]
MTSIITLNEMEHLKWSEFGRPWPRHGLHLLHWFSQTFVTFDNNGNLVALYDPRTQAFGFHRFENRPEFNSDGSTLLPNQNIPYYEVGNLNTPGVEHLPDYVKQNHRRHRTSNMDRVIINVHSRLVVDKVYVTQHEDMRTFDQKNTYRISKGLVKIIRNLKLEDLLELTGYTVSANMMVFSAKRLESTDIEDANCLSPKQMTQHVIDMPDETWSLSNLPERRVYNQPRRERRCCVIL